MTAAPSKLRMSLAIVAAVAIVIGVGLAMGAWSTSSSAPACVATGRQAIDVAQGWVERATRSRAQRATGSLTASVRVTVPAGTPVVVDLACDPEQGWTVTDAQRRAW